MPEVPVGTIVAWYPFNRQGKFRRVPDGWVLCDGETAGVPDLSSRFIRGATLGTDVTGDTVFQRGSTQFVPSAPDDTKLFGGGMPTTAKARVDPGGEDRDFFFFAQKEREGPAKTPEELLPPHYLVVFIMRVGREAEEG